MYPGEARIRELRTRFKVHSGQVLEPNRYKNMNWYLCTDTKVNRNDPGEWFCYGDIDEIQISVIRTILKPGEFLVLGWKDQGPDARDIGDISLIITPSGSLYDLRRDGPIKEPK